MKWWSLRRTKPVADAGDSSLLLSRWGDEPAPARRRARTTRSFAPSSVMLLRDRMRPASPTDRWPRRLAWAGALIGFAAMLLLQAPASWLAGAVAQATGQQILLAQARGRIWDGDAVLVLTAGAGGRDARALPGRLTWRMRPVWAQGPGLRLELQQDCCIPIPMQVLLSAGWGTTRIALPPGPAGEAWRTHWPAELLNGLGTPWNTLDTRGQLRVSSPGMTLTQVEGRWLVEGGAELELRDMSSRVATLRTLGSYRMRVDGGGSVGATRLRLDTLEGALQLQGEGEWTALGLRFRGEATAREADQAALSNLLNIIGRREGARSILSIG